MNDESAYKLIFYRKENANMLMNLAHRGASAYAPENTMASFYKAIEVGANGIETDLRKTKDGHIILFHDDDIAKKTNGTGPVSSHTLDELKRLDAGSWFSPVYSNERLVTFEEFLHFFGRKDITFDIELKDSEIEEQTLELINKYEIKEKTTITSFLFENLEAVRKLDSNIKLGHLIDKIDNQSIERLKYIDAQQICPCASQLDKNAVLLAKKYGFVVRAWGVDNEDLMKHVLLCGVDGMTVNFPDKLAVFYSKDQIINLG
jgi:glycerophosphoryl diester phosphodiesterase